MWTLNQRFVAFEKLIKWKKKKHPLHLANNFEQEKSYTVCGLPTQGNSKLGNEWTWICFFLCESLDILRFFSGEEVGKKCVFLAKKRLQLFQK